MVANDASCRPGRGTDAYVSDGSGVIDACTDVGTGTHAGAGAGSGSESGCSGHSTAADHGHGR